MKDFDRHIFTKRKKVSLKEIIFLVAFCAIILGLVYVADQQIENARAIGESLIE